jgi:hypothetical protein
MAYCTILGENMKGFHVSQKESSSYHGLTVFIFVFLPIFYYIRQFNHPMISSMMHLLKMKKPGKKPGPVMF